ncbi:G-type lectin S-receptor-like serine/threonine-protein kinase LECRK1 [Glycine max]|uniref:Receptor-like serine/threonine-protein kinase n=4 Tax=Glycine subgen. Soja TaxID=1462606 RepID=A0A0R0H9S2_SOYBN|nr:G-type lectin S-receptor-like serine/threonine-protein kinase LECRK1 [Glycine soja]KAH1223025.1 G-type lectin S-receptor-like serine/threonine-protein kinase LECRK1 [Glycine max]RZB77420.1 G-type lectin S-receptor-like serine/threonine-protein kinase LECRK1 [Glycine soja]|eukprot:XP_003539656.1 G-type lectin S-receptor-like serine/threonine-protein kinase LECRK1 [Glycine max]
MASSTFLHSYSLLLLIILPFLPSVFSATSSNCSANSIHLNSTLVTNHTWNSPSGLFAFGFQNVLSNKEFMSVLAVWFPKDPHRTIVWYAKYKQTSDLGTMHAVSSMQKSLAFPSDSTVKLTNKGIVLYDQNGQEMWHRPKNNSIALVRCASMLDSGNFVLLDETGKHVWESFEEPTDTFLPGQILAKPKSFRARHSNTSFYDGSFELAWQSDYNFVLYYSPQSSVTREAYWATQTNSYDESLLVFNESGHMYIKRSNTGKVIREVLYGGSEEFLYMARIDPDGLFRLYRHRKDDDTIADSCSSGWWSVVDRYPKDICLSITMQTGNAICGYNSYCITINGNPSCECPDIFSSFDHDNNLKTCRPDFPLPSCNKDGWEQNKDLVDFKEYQNLDWPLSDYDKLVGTAMDKDMCRQKCLEDCFCAVAIYGEGQCWKKKYPLSNGRKHPNVTRIALVKIPKTGLNKDGTGSLGNGREQSTIVLVISILLGSSVFLNVILLVALFAAFYIFYHKKLLNSPNLSAATIRYYTYKELEEATTGFKQMLGRGAFGTVYKGVLKSDTSRYVAVKRLDKVVQEGEKEFKTEVSVIGQTHHRNLVRLLGYCDEEEHRLLVYEYMNNGSLACFLFGISRPHWNQRVQIALGIARGLTYLHEECSTQIIHCDIKPQNILLDELFTPRIADFGLAKLLLAEQSKATKTGLRGTVGYFAPEWFRKASITTKVDVYSFGVVLLEIICCKSSVSFAMASEEETLIDWAYRCYSQGKVAKLVENDEEAKKDIKRVEKHVMVAIWCIQEDPSLRPSMKKVTQMLEGVTTVSLPPRPAIFSSSSFETSFTL